MSEGAPVLLAFGNPLLDVTLVVKDDNLHKTFNLPIDGQLEVTPEQRKLFDIIMKRDDIEYSAGGCALNTSRVFSWVLGMKNRVVFVGGIGVDDKSKKLSKIIQESGVLTRFVNIENKPTGSCVALVLGTQRCLSADIGAAAVCEPHHVFRNQTLDYLESSSIIYVEGYFITHSFQTALQLAKYAQEKNKLLVFNLCGSYVCENHPKELSELLSYVDILFGYIEEYRTLNRHINIPSTSKSTHSNNIFRDLKNVCSHLFKNRSSIGDEQESITTNGLSHPSYINGVNNLNNGQNTCHPQKLKDLKNIKDSKLVIVTQGPGPLTCSSHGCLYIQDVGPISPEDIVDTTGAGDSFVGGFLAALVRNRSLEECLDCGMWTAQQLLCQKGCTIPSHPANFLSKTV